jgi:MFS transporter, putative metabolite:H+ symporter
MSDIATIDSGLAGKGPRSDVAAEHTVSVEQISGRIERMPISPWHAKARVTLGVATFFDAFDALTVAQVLPVLVPVWNIDSHQVGLLISAGYLGQLVGALFFGWLAGRIGRLRAIIGAITIFSLMSLCCAFAWNYDSLLVFRAIQGIGLGGEVPIAAVYISEITRAHGRGKFVLLYEFIFTVGVFSCGVIGTFIMPLLGWQFMFTLGAIPLIVAALLLRILPESPRWLASKGRLVEADAALKRIETSIERSSGQKLALPEIRPSVDQKKASWSDYFGPKYLGRTLVIWTVWFCSYIVYYGIGTWMPTLYKTVFNLPVEQSLRYALITNFCGVLACLLCIFTIDKFGRRPLLIVALAGSGLSLGMLYAFGVNDLHKVILVASVGYFFATISALGAYVYTPELYPTRARAQGFGMAGAWLRLASMVGPLFVGIMIKSGVEYVFLGFAAVVILGGIIVSLFAVETAGRTLEELSP